MTAFRIRLVLALTLFLWAPAEIASQAPSQRDLTLTMDLIRAAGPSVDPRLSEISEGPRRTRVLSELRRLFELEGFEVLDTASAAVQLSASEPAVVERRPTITGLGEIVIEARISSVSGVPDADVVQVDLDLTGAVSTPMDASLIMRDGRAAALVFPRQPEGSEDYLVLVVAVDFRP